MSLQYFMREAIGTSWQDVSGHARKYLLDVKQNAEEGSVAISTVVLDDPDGTLIVGPWKAFYILEDEAEDPDQTAIYVGHVTNIQIKRGPYRTGAGREVHVQVSDVNNMLNRRILIGADNDRPVETDNARVPWVLSTSEGEVINNNVSMVTATSPESMDANDYLGQEMFAVYNDCAQQSGKNFFLTHKGESGPYPFGDYAMFYDKAGSDTYQSAARLTNLLSDIDPTGDPATFYVTREPVEFTIDPSRQASGIFVPYQESYVFVRDYDAEFAARDLNMPAINVKNQATALRRANRYLRDASTPDHRATLQFITPRAKVNAIREGMAVQVKMTHWPEPYRSAYTWMRVLNRQIVDQSEGDDQTYLQTIEVSRSETIDTATCTGLTATGSFYPLGGSDPPNASGGNVLYLRPGIPYPEVVSPGHIGSWHFPVFGAGGSGTVDQAGDCGQNTVRCLVVGDGTIEVHSSTVSSSRNLVARLIHQDSGAPNGYVVDETQYGVTGDDFTFTVSTHNGVNCTHWVDLGDTGSVCGGKWGFSGFDWTAA